MGEYLLHRFWARLLQIIQMLSLYEYAEEAVVRFYSRAKLEYLPMRNYKLGQGPNALHVDTDLEMALVRIFHGPPEHWSKCLSHRVVETYSKRIDWVDAASVCEELREYMSEYVGCPAYTCDEGRDFCDPKKGDNQECIQTDFVLGYNILERQAYAETKRNVYQLVGTKLPMKLINMVSEYALEVQRIPKVPRMYDFKRPEIMECEGEDERDLTGDHRKECDEYCFEKMCKFTTHGQTDEDLRWKLCLPRINVKSFCFTGSSWDGLFERLEQFERAC